MAYFARRRPDTVGPDTEFSQSTLDRQFGQSASLIDTNDFPLGFAKPSHVPLWANVWGKNAFFYGQPFGKSQRSI
jgi:hypothetical protein